MASRVHRTFKCPSAILTSNNLSNHSNYTCRIIAMLLILISNAATKDNDYDDGGGYGRNVSMIQLVHGGQISDATMRKQQSWAQDDGGDAEKKALLAFKSSLKGLSSEIALRNWVEVAPVMDNAHNMSSNTTTNPVYCEWDGILCQGSNVVSLQLQGMGLMGPISPHLANLTHLKVLNLSSNALNGPIPTSIFTNLIHLESLDLSQNMLSGLLSIDSENLSHLQHLNLASNSLSGPLPPRIGSLPNLQTLDLNTNGFAGPIPSRIGDLGSLTYLDLSFNGFTSLPPELGSLGPNLVSLDLSNNVIGSPFHPGLGNLTRLQYMDLSNNSISGPLPKEIGNMVSLVDLILSLNKISGPLPPELGFLTSLVSLTLTNNYIEGPLPHEIGHLHNLEKLDLTMNSITGSLPEAIGSLASLRILSVANNLLNGSLPSSLGNCTNLETLILSFNSISGPLPDTLAGLRGSIIAFSAEKNELSGALPVWLGTWTRVNNLLLGSNRFSGGIIPELGNCSSLTSLSLEDNHLSGAIPSELCNAIGLDTLSLQSNGLAGTISGTFRRCRNLTEIHLDNNHLEGAIPASLVSLPLLVSIELAFNGFSGPIPDELWTNPANALLGFEASNNRLSGRISPLIGSLTSLQHLGLTGNQLQGSIPKEIGKLVNLQGLFLGGNRLSGSIPPELFGCTELTTLDLGSNLHLSGSIPHEIGKLVNLECLVLSHNNFSGPIPPEICFGFQQTSIPTSSYLQHHGYFDLSWNSLSGSIPLSIGNCIVLVELYLNENRLSGGIPSQLSDLTNLTAIDLSGNFLTGQVPEQLGDLHKLQGLNLGFNNLNGEIPSSLGELRSLVTMNMTHNELSGYLPAELGHLASLQHLDLSSNKITGNIPFSWSHMNGIISLYLQENEIHGSLDDLFSSAISSADMIMWPEMGTLNLSHNALYGTIPIGIGNLSALNSLDLHDNSLDGPIPDAIGRLSQLVYLDLSANGIQGHIPWSICGLSELEFLNISSNQLSGELPSHIGVCKNFSAWSFRDNVGLCGDVIEVGCHLGMLSNNNSDNRYRFSTTSLVNKGAMVGIILGSAIAIACFMFVLLRWRLALNNGVDGTNASSSLEHHDQFADEKKKILSIEHCSNISSLSSKTQREPLSINVAMFERPLLRLTLADILRITDNFSKSNVIGDGGFGTVYKAMLCGDTEHHHRKVAIKKLRPAGLQGPREFLAEMETLGKVKHQNLVPLLGYCTFGDEKILVYDYMVNGSLDMWLRNGTDALRALDWGKRFKIALGSARGLAFLHHGFIPHIIHRDMKASNILLDAEFEPKVADFGLARLISACETHVTTDIAGTLGYIPPEYGQSWRSTTRGDVYSYGVILFELLTGREPTGPDFKEAEAGNLVGWVRQMMKNGRVADIFDPVLAFSSSDDSDENNTSSRVKMLQVLRVATLCTSDDPFRRPTMLQVVKYLKEIDQPFDSSICRQKLGSDHVASVV